MARRRKSRRSSGRRYRRFRHHRMGLVGTVSKTIRNIGRSSVKIAGPAMMGAGGLLLAIPPIGHVIDGVKSKNIWTMREELASSGSDVMYYAAPAATLIIGGWALSKAAKTF